MNQLQTVNKAILTTELKDKLKEQGFNDLCVGDSVWDSYYGIMDITNIDKEGIHVKFEDTTTYNDGKKETRTRTKLYEWSSSDTSKLIKLEMSYEEYEKESLEFFMNPKQYEIKQKLLTANSKETDTTAIMVKGSDVDLMNSQSLLKRMTDKMVILQSILADKKRQMENMRSEFMEKLKQINKVITVLEIYMGIDEEIIQFKEGLNAPMDEPLHFRQRLLYMDEEMAYVSINIEGGADISNIEDFQDWVIKNYKQLVPEEKCVVAMRPRRYKKKYGNRWLDRCMNNAENNFATFVLIRNGENFYRIWTNKFNILKRLFPKVDQFDKIMVEDSYPFSEDKRLVEKYKEGYNDEEEAEKAKEYYKFNILMMQGLIDRTELFKPMKDEVNLFDPRTYGESVKLVLDDEMIIHTGRPTFKEYIKELNKGIKRGSRIYLSLGSDDENYYIRDKYSNRFKINYSNEHNVPDRPSNGIYTIIETPKRWQWKEYKDNRGEEYNDEQLYVISYNPGGEVRNSWDYYDYGHERKNKTRFYLEKYDTMFNYDVLDLDDIDYYLNDRIERHDYMYMFPIAKKLKEIRAKELEWEKSFVRLVKDRNQCSEELVWECVEWWKLKNIWKRPITKDDAKALRMIESRIKKLKK